MGEAYTAEWFRKRRYKVLAMNYRCNFGELDLVVANRKELIFVEVKLRKNADYGAAREFVTRAKQERLLTTAQLWLSENPGNDQPRFDVIEVYAPQGMEGPVRIHHIENAFM